MNTVIRRWLAVWALAAPSLGLAVAAPLPATNPPGDKMPATVAYETCSWDHPGVNPFMGDVVAAVDRYRDIPPEVRERLKARMAKREYDDLVSIRRDAITGRGGYRYGNAIADMHFGTHQVCHAVTRASWTPQMEERGLVYCESGTCILVPTVCRNVSRVSRNGVGNDVAEALPPFLPPGAGYPAAPAATVAEALPLADAPVVVGNAVPPVVSLGALRDGGPIGNAMYVGYAGPVVGGSSALGVTALGSAGGGSGGAAAGGGSGASTSAGTNSGTAGAGTLQTTTGAVPGDGTDAGATAITPVPEPETWALMLGGLGALGWRQRRGRASRAG